MSTNARTRTKARRFGGRKVRRGVASVLAMMFLILFGSLIAAMSVASTGNIRTAAMHLHVMRAMSAAETGMEIAESRMDEAASRFLLSESQITPAIIEAAWTGDTAGMGTHTVRTAPSGYSEGSLPSGIAEALANHHDADLNILVGLGYTENSSIGAAPSGIDTTVYAATDWVYTPAVALAGQSEGQVNPPPSYQVRYAPLADWSAIRIIVDGIVFDYGRNGQPIRRTIMKDYALDKTVQFAIISHSRILIGKNVSIEGDVGARYDEVTFDDGDPVITRSDFYGLDANLDAKLDALYAQLALNDVDSDNRLRTDHPVEGVMPADADFDGDGSLDGAYQDATQDGFVDDFDVFIRHYDTNGDGRVALSTALTVGTPAELFAPEFVDGADPVDDDLALLLDTALPDRNRNGISGWADTDFDGWFDAGTEFPNDFDAGIASYADQVLGWRDGFIDAQDQYAKIAGTMLFTATSADWIAQQGDYRAKLQGPVRPGEGSPPLVFGADDTVIPNINATSFVDTENDIIAAADGDVFWQQVADQLGVDILTLDLWDGTLNLGGADDPYYGAVWADLDFDGRPDNYTTAYWERSPYNAPNFADIYYRPVFRNMVFRNVQIPQGLNGLFENCTFVGATYVRSYTINTHPLWSEYGSMHIAGDGYPAQKYDRYIYGNDGSEPDWDAPQILPASARPPLANVLMTLTTATPLDKADVRESEQGTLLGVAYADLPDPLIVGSDRYVDTKLLSNNIRFHDCLFVGSVVADTPTGYTQVRNKLQFTGATGFAQVHPEEPGNGFLNPDEADEDTLAQSSMMLPNYSVDLGSFNSPPEQDVRLTGAIIAGVLDARGNTEIHGTLLLTFDPEYGTAPLLDVFGNPLGNPAGFNASIGYFGQDDGDMESMDPNDLPTFGGVKIVGWDTNGDGLFDVPHSEPQPPGSTAVPFNGFGHIRIRQDPNMTLPSGLMLPLSAPVVAASYQEGNL
ncbi:MAG: hypothetical protein DHS20C14_15140 [Phycisphaeraceae bacterium]|nr:MAG: hypothetical protein DHS20C14_15140 [Phycisphaeraceae bacterium]